MTNEPLAPQKTFLEGEESIPTNEEEEDSDLKDMEIDELYKQRDTLEVEAKNAVSRRSYVEAREKVAKKEKIEQEIRARHSKLETEQANSKKASNLMRFDNETERNVHAMEDKKEKLSSTIRDVWERKMKKEFAARKRGTEDENNQAYEDELNKEIERRMKECDGEIERYKRGRRRERRDLESKQPLPPPKERVSRR